MSVKSEVTLNTFWRCAIPSCRLRWEARIPTRVYSVPSETMRLQAWLEACPFLRTYDLRQPQNVKLCKLHFTPDCFDDVGNLTPDAIPTLKLPNLDETLPCPQHKGHKQLFIEITPIESSTSYLIETCSLIDISSPQYCNIDSRKNITCICSAKFPDKQTFRAYISNTRKRFFKCTGDEYKNYIAQNNKVVPNKKTYLGAGNLFKTTNFLKMNAYTPEFKIPNTKYVPRKVNNIANRKCNHVLNKPLISQIKTTEMSKESIPTMPLTTKPLQHLYTLKESVTKPVSTILTPIEEKSTEKQNSSDLESNVKQDIHMKTDNVMYTIVKKNIKQSMENKETDCDLEQDEYEIVMEKCPPIEECTKMHEDHKQPTEECIEIDEDNNQSVEECTERDVEKNQQVKEHDEILEENDQPIEERTKLVEENTQIFVEHSYSIKKHI